MIQKIRNLFKFSPKPKCAFCNSTNLSRTGTYTRGWNNLCKQAAGDSGRWCYNCLKVTFIKTLAEYKAQLPEWVTAWPIETIYSPTSKPELLKQKHNKMKDK